MMDHVSRAQMADNSAVAATKQAHLAQYRWPKGVSGNPKGRPPKAQYLTRLYRRLLRSRKNQKDIGEAVLKELTSKGMAKVLLLREVAERLEGKVDQTVNENLNVTLSLAESVANRRKQLDAD